MDNLGDRILIILGLLCCSVICFAEQGDPGLNISIWHKAEAFFKNGDILECQFNIKHDNKSSASAVNINVLWYLPDYLEFERARSSNDGFLAERIQGSSNVKIKIAKVSAGESVSGVLSINIDPNSTLGKWNHQIIVFVQLIWYAESQNNDGERRYNLPLIPYSINVTIAGCIEPLGMSNGQIRDHQLSADASDPELMPKKARPNDDAWCSRDNILGNYIQVFFEKKVRVTLIMTWGRHRKEQWVEKYHLNYSMDGINWIPYKENGFAKELTGSSGPEKEFLLFPIIANAIRIMPLKWKQRICMRFELYGCVVGTEENCISPVGIENGQVPDEAFDDSINGTVDGLIMQPVNARLNRIVETYPYGWMARPNQQDWLQIDLGSIFKITRFAVQGSFPPHFFVQTYKVLYSNNGIDWKKVNESGREKIFDGPKTAAEAEKPILALLSKPIYGRYFRFIPMEFISGKVMRLEIYGCVFDGGKSTPGRTDTDFDRKYPLRCVLLDPVRNHFYVCLRQVTDSVASCVRNKLGQIWEMLDAPITRIIGLDVENEMLYGTDRQLSYLVKTNNQKTWAFVSKEHWNETSAKPMFVEAVQLPDILVGKMPIFTHQWKSNDGMVWGASGNGIHIKQKNNETWQLIGTWKCCGA